LNITKVEQLRDKVIGLCPVYLDGGNSTKVLLDDGQMVFDRRVLLSTQLALFHSYGLDFSAQKDYLKERLTRQGVLPFYLNNRRVFVPLKMRKPKASRDAVYGYIDINYLDSNVESLSANTCQVSLLTGSKVTILSNKDTVIKSLHVGQEVLTLLQQDQLAVDEETRIAEAIRTLVQAICSIARQK
jgi:hypothetical protein